MVDVAVLSAAYDGPIPPAELAAARWGAGAWERLARGADVGLIEARLHEAVASLGRLRLAAGAAAMLQPLVRAVAQYRRAALAMLSAADLD